MGNLKSSAPAHVYTEHCYQKTVIYIEYIDSYRRYIDVEPLYILTYRRYSVSLARKKNNFLLELKESI